MADIVEKNNSLWEVLYKVWIEQGRPGYVTFGENLYRVLSPSDDDIKFLAHGSPQILYESRSTKGLSK